MGRYYQRPMKVRTPAPDAEPLTWLGALRQFLGRWGLPAEPSQAQAAPLAQAAPQTRAHDLAASLAGQDAGWRAAESSQPQDALAQRAAFWSTATHDLCQPAQALALFIDRLQRLPADPKAQQVHAYLDSSMQDLTRLLSGLLEVARLDAGQVQPVLAPVSVDALLARVAQDIAPSAQEKGLRVRVRSAGQWVQSDRAMLEPLVLALAHNAVRFTDRGTVFLSVRSAVQGRSLRLDVSDSGIGIAERDHAKVFEPFAQRNVARQSPVLRPSLSLYIAQRNAVLLGSHLQLRSALGRGSRFSLVLPKADGPASPPGSEWHTDAVHANRMDIVLVDGDAPRRAQLQALLTSWGCTVHSAQTLSDFALLRPEQGLRGIVVAWDDAQGQDFMQAIQAWHGAPLPVCVVYAQATALQGPPLRQQSLVFLPEPLQVAPLRAWLRRLPPSDKGTER